VDVYLRSSVAASMMQRDRNKTTDVEAVTFDFDVAGVFAPRAHVRRFRFASNHDHDGHDGSTETLQHSVTVGPAGDVHQPAFGRGRRGDLIEPPEVRNDVSVGRDLVRHEVDHSAVSRFSAANLTVRASLNPEARDEQKAESCCSSGP